MATVQFIEYPKCSTCKRAHKWLDDRQVSYVDRNIVEDTPTQGELKEWIGRSGLPLKRFFNTSGKLYRELAIKQRFEEGISDEEAIELLASNGMLIKRPLLVGEDFVIPGFKEEAWIQALHV